MLLTRIAVSILLLALFVICSMVIGSCGGDDPPASTTGVVLDPGGGPDDDFIVLTVDGGAESTYIEASGLPTIDCEPRVDWGASQVILWDDFTSGSGPNGYALFFEIMFPAVDTVGTYTVQGDFLQALYYSGEYYSAGPFTNGTSGTVQVSRSDTRIEGIYDITVVDSAQTTSVRLNGEFGVDKGFSLSCP